jgi:C4-type Zn-finger protein
VSDVGRNPFLAAEMIRCPKCGSIEAAANFKVVAAPLYSEIRTGIAKCPKCNYWAEVSWVMQQLYTSPPMEEEVT